LEAEAVLIGRVVFTERCSQIAGAIGPIDGEIANNLRNGIRSTRATFQWIRLAVKTKFDTDAARGEPVAEIGSAAARDPSQHRVTKNA
jgi:hypothetical protein